MLPRVIMLNKQGHLRKLERDSGVMMILRHKQHECDTYPI